MDKEAKRSLIMKYSGTSISGGAWDGRNWNWPHSPFINLYYEVLIYYLIASLFGVLIN